jgi:hypothetical protein
VPDQPGGLHNILASLGNGGINVEYMYAFVRQSGQNAVMIFRFDNTDEALRVLGNAGVSVLDGETLYGL